MVFEIQAKKMDIATIQNPENRISGAIQKMASLATGKLWTIKNCTNPVL